MQVLSQILYRLNKVLSVILFMISIYMIGMPFYPQAQFVIDKFTNSEERILETESWITDPNYNETHGEQDDAQPTPTEEGATPVEDSDTFKLNSLGQVNKLVIPSIGIDGVIYEGASVSTLNNGIWRRPNTSKPDMGGNTVMSAHRFLYESGPITFYHLDKVKVGDKIYVLWKNKRYEYQVFNISEVLPTQVEIEANTKDPIITLYTCTPLWTAEKRLVVKAKLLNSN
ncbi:sortase [Candidatus Dojkabacteria bacterium]|nr:sortase [Candidatus Dojkabacteria bacterium]